MSRLRLHQTRSSVHDYRQIAAAMAISTVKLRFKPTPSPVNFGVAATELDEAAECDVNTHRRLALRRTCRSAMTSHSRLPVSATQAATEISSSTAASSSPLKVRVSAPDVIADAGMTRGQFTWLREVGRCLNPHRRHPWSD